jgi:hypothetical protein
MSEDVYNLLEKSILQVRTHPNFFAAKEQPISLYLGPQLNYFDLAKKLLEQHPGAVVVVYDKAQKELFRDSPSFDKVFDMESRITLNTLFSDIIDQTPDLLILVSFYTYLEEDLISDLTSDLGEELPFLVQVYLG